MVKAKPKPVQQLRITNELRARLRLATNTERLNNNDISITLSSIAEQALDYGLTKMGY